MSAPKLFPAVAESESLSPLDVQLAGLLRRSAQSESEGDLLAVSAGLVSRLRARGHSCLHLDRWAGRSSGGAEGARLPSRDAWRTVLEQSDLVAVSPRSDTAPRPLVLDDRDRLYLWRYWWAEQDLARELRRRLGGGPALEDLALEDRLDKLAPLFQRLFPRASIEPGAEIDWQAVAASAALSRPVALVSGGPGTGKTTTVTRILALLAALDSDARIALAAPTGKAAARLEESIAEQLTSLDAEPEIRGRVPRRASTLHRLLGYSPRTDTFRYGASTPLAVDVLVVDEASMVDLLMMRSLVRALPADARLILLGDRDQLASVDTGFVFGDLAGAAGLGPGMTEDRLPPRLEPVFRRLLGEEPTPPEPAEPVSPLDGAAVELRISYRFRDRPGIGALARAVRAGDERGTLQALDDPSLEEVILHAPPAPEHARRAVEILGAELEACVSAAGPEEALGRLAGFRILAATRVGPWGTERLNRLVEGLLESRGFSTAERFYPGKPVLVESNDYAARLFNGDLGMIWPHEGGLWAFFPDDGDPDPGSASTSGLRRLPLAKLPPFSTAWAMTVHKSQGSEFDRVLMVLPEHEMGDLLSRELVYTGITRARRRVDLVARPSILEAAVRAGSRRSSGLAEALAGDPERVS